MRICQALLVTLSLVLSVSLFAQRTPSPKDAKPGEVLAARSMDIPIMNPGNAALDYLIGADDMLSVDVWKEPEISRIVPVRPDGKISLPLINDVQAAGMSPTQLALQITEQLRKTLVNPQVTVIVTQINSQRIYILGEVTRGGAYPLLPNMTVLQALSSAGSVTPFANLKKIYIMRTTNGRQQMLLFNYKEVVSGQKVEQNVRLQAGDTIVVP
jgi:polysaccharide biosynthesis/export protein